MALPVKAREQRRQRIVELAALGKSQDEIGKIIGIDQSTVSDYLNKPKSVEELEALRLRVRSMVMEQTSDGIVAGTLGLVRKAITDQDPKALELTTKSALNLEKLTASASGEAKKVEVKDVTPPPTAADLKVLIAQLLSVGAYSEPAPLALHE
jgi:predicted transcriptional regulator